MKGITSSWSRAGNREANGLQGFKFDAVYTSQDIGSYKPDHKNFEYMLKHVKDKFRFKKEEVLQTAQSQVHDHLPAKEMGITSSWIHRAEAVMGNLNVKLLSMGKRKY